MSTLDNIYFPDFYIYKSIVMRSAQFTLLATVGRTYNLTFNSLLHAQITLLEIVDSFTFIFSGVYPFDSGRARDSQTFKFILNEQSANNGFRVANTTLLSVE